MIAKNLLKTFLLVTLAMLSSFAFADTSCPLPPGVVFVPANQIDIVLTPRVIFNGGDETKGMFTYEYFIYSKPDSQQEVREFTVEFLSDKAEPVDFINFPTGRYGWFPLSAVNAKSCPTCDDPNNNLTWAAEGVDGIPPGESLGPLGVDGNGLPGIVRTWTQGNAPIPLVPDEVTDVHCIPDDWSPGDSVIIKTVGIDILPGSLTPLQLLARLIGLKEQTLQLGWITNKGVANALDAKLNEANKALQRGETNVTINLLKSFILDLEAQHQGQTAQGKGASSGNAQTSGKHVTDNAYYLLKPNAEFILYKLGVTSFP